MTLLAAGQDLRQGDGRDRPLGLRWLEQRVEVYGTVLVADRDKRMVLRDRQRRDSSRFFGCE